MANTSQTLLPSLQLPRLKEFNVSGNHLTFVPPNTLSNLSEVRVLDLSCNELPAPPSNAWHSMHNLRVLRMGGNPITKVIYLHPTLFLAFWSCFIIILKKYTKLEINI